MSPSAATITLHPVRLIPWPIPSTPPWYGSGWRMGVSSDDPTSTVVDVEVNTQWDDIGYDPAADDDDGDIDDVAGMRSAANDDDYDDDDLLSAGSTVSVDVVYDAGSSVMMLQVRLADGSGAGILAHRNLKEQGLPQIAAVGLSVAQGTGDHFASPVVISWSFSSTDPSIPEPSIPLWVTAVSCVAIAILAASLVSALLFFITRKRWAATTVNTELKGAKEFSHQELSASTNNDFSDDPRMPPLAVKVLTRPMEPQSQDEEGEGLRHRGHDSEAASFPNCLVNSERLDGDFDESQMRRVLVVGLLCGRKLERPSQLAVQ